MALQFAMVIARLLLKITNESQLLKSCHEGYDDLCILKIGFYFFVVAVKRGS